MSDTDFILTPGFKQLEMLTAGLSVLPCCSPCLPWQQESSAWFLGVHPTFCEESWQLHFERFPSSECDTEFGLVQCAILRGTTSPGLWRWGVPKGRNGEWQIQFPSVCAGRITVWPGQAVSSPTLAEMHRAALQPRQAALPPCPRLLGVTCCHSLSNALLERWCGALELLQWELQWLKGIFQMSPFISIMGWFWFEHFFFFVPNRKNGSCLFSSSWQMAVGRILVTGCLWDTERHIQLKACPSSRDWLLTLTGLFLQTAC